MLEPWHIWIIAAITSQYSKYSFLPSSWLSFGVGCLAASVAAVLHLGIKMQIGAFIVGTLAAFFGFVRFSPGIVTGRRRESKRMWML